MTKLGGRIRWLTLCLVAATAGASAVGASVSAALAALGLATAAAGAALLLAGPVFRVILGVLIAALGGCVLLVVVAQLTETSWATPLVVPLCAGAVQVVVGAGVVATSRYWPTTAKKYSRTRIVGGDVIADWDALSAGEDPTILSSEEANTDQVPDTGPQSPRDNDPAD